MNEREFLKRKSFLNCQAARLFLREGNLIQAVRRLCLAIIFGVEAERS